MLQLNQGKKWLKPKRRVYICLKYILLDKIILTYFLSAGTVWQSVIFGILSFGILSFGIFSRLPRKNPSRTGAQSPRFFPKLFHSTTSPDIDVLNLFSSSLTSRPNKLEGLSLETLSSQVLECVGKARANPIGAPFRCFLLGQVPGVTSKC
jgi:hypothetical protein